MADAKSGEGDVAINVPRKNANDLYLSNIMACLGTHRQVFSEIDNVTDPKIISSTRECIIAILDDVIRKDLLNAFETALSEVYSVKGLDNNQKGHLVVRVCQNAVGEVYSFLDEYIGLSRINITVPVYVAPPEQQEGKEDGDSDTYSEEEDASVDPETQPGAKEL